MGEIGSAFARRRCKVIETLFTNLGGAVEGAPLLAICAAAAWGILSIILSPCHLASIPLIVGFIDVQGKISVKRAFVISVLFAVGILISIAAIGMITASAGRIMGDIGAWSNYFVAAVLLLAGLVLTDTIAIPWSAPAHIGIKSKGMPAAFSLGLIFGIALGPCTFAFMAPILGVVLQQAARSFAFGVVLLLAYGIGHCSVIVAAGTSTEAVQRFLNWDEGSKATLILKRICGALVILASLYMIYIS
jgi:cytochrome c-type biogenesis protein